MLRPMLRRSSSAPIQIPLSTYDSNSFVPVRRTHRDNLESTSSSVSIRPHRLRMSDKLSHIKNHYDKGFKACCTITSNIAKYQDNRDYPAGGTLIYRDLGEPLKMLCGQAKSVNRLVQKYLREYAEVYRLDQEDPLDLPMQRNEDSADGVIERVMAEFAVYLQCLEERPLDRIHVHDTLTILTGIDRKLEAACSTLQWYAGRRARCSTFTDVFTGGCQHFNSKG